MVFVFFCAAFWVGLWCRLRAIDFPWPVGLALYGGLPAMSLCLYWYLGSVGMDSVYLTKNPKTADDLIRQLYHGAMREPLDKTKWKKLIKVLEAAGQADGASQARNMAKKWGHGF
jgi:hypothetical protein